MDRRIVIKTGSQVLCGPAGALNRGILSGLTSQFGALRAAGNGPTGRQSYTRCRS